MSALRITIAAICAIPLLLSACGKTVTNYVPTSTSSTPGTSSPQTPASSLGAHEDPSSGGGGGTINGGGGKGVRCTKNGKTTVEVLDLYEAKSLYNLKIIDVGSTEEAAQDKLAELIAKHVWNPYSVEMPKFKTAMREYFVRKLLNNIHFIDSGRKLKLTNDSYEPTIESGCEAVQIAMYYDESVLLVDKSLWQQMDWTNRVGLMAHEIMYFYARQAGITNSIGSRKLVGKMFSTEGLKGMADGAPADSHNYLNCDLKKDGFPKGNFYLFREPKSEGPPGLKAIFFGLNRTAAMFQTTAYFEKLSFKQLLSFPTFTATRTSTLVKDSYPDRNELELQLKGVVADNLTGSLRILRGVESSPELLDVSCRIPHDIKQLDTTTVEPAEFESTPNGGSVDRIKIESDGAVTLERSQQVGGPGGISNQGLVPYPTECRTIVSAILESRSADSISYTAMSIKLGDQTGSRFTEHCQEYVDKYNRIAADGSVRYTESLKTFKKVR